MWIKYYKNFLKNIFLFLRVPYLKMLALCFLSFLTFFVYLLFSVYLPCIDDLEGIVIYQHEDDEISGVYKAICMVRDESCVLSVLRGFDSLSSMFSYRNIIFVFDSEDMLKSEIEVRINSMICGIYTYDVKTAYAISESYRFEFLTDPDYISYDIYNVDLDLALKSTSSLALYRIPNKVFYVNYMDLYKTTVFLPKPKINFHLSAEYCCLLSQAQPLSL